MTIIFLSRGVRDEQKELGAQNWLGWSTLNRGGRIYLEDLSHGEHYPEGDGEHGRALGWSRDRVRFGFL